MMLLHNLIQEALPEITLSGATQNIMIRGIEWDSRKVEKEFLLIGEKNEPRTFNLPFIEVQNARETLAKLASIYYGKPHEKIKVIGITGTNGKTTSSFILEHFLKSEQKKVGVLGTINTRYDENVIPAAQTTPGPLQVQAILSQMVK